MVGVSDFLMTSLAKLTVKVGKGVKDVVAESEVGTCTCTVVSQVSTHAIIIIAASIQAIYIPGTSHVGQNYDSRLSLFNYRK